MISSPLRGLAGRPVWVRLVLALLLAGMFRLSWELATHWDALQDGTLARFSSLLLLRCAALAAGAWALAAALREPKAEAALVGRRRPAGLPAAAATIVLAAIAVASLVQLTADAGVDRFAARSAFRSVLLLGTSVWLALSVLSPRETTSAWGGRWRRLGVVAVNLLLALALLEGVSLLFAHARPTRLLWDESSVRATIEANRLEPGSTYLGFPVNSGGYYDEEFHRAGPGDLVVALLADSFGVGIVPFKHNFATVAERRLARRSRIAGRVAVNNFAVASIGLPEYAWLLENEVPATAPTRVVVALFVGNDVSALAARRQPGVYALQQFQLFELGRRLLALARASRGSAVTPGGRRKRGFVARREGGTFDEETFLGIERATVEMCNTRSPTSRKLYREAFHWLDRLRLRAGDKLLVVLIPDEYQVNDELYETLMGRVPDPAAYRRLYPQERLSSHCRARGIEVLDLLGPLRRANEERPVYQLRDTHWNARGNRIAGEAIARYLLEGPSRS